MPESHGQNHHEATLGFPKLAQISQAPTEKHNFLTGGVTPYPQLASESLCPLFGAGGLGSRWPLGWLLSLSPLSALLPSHSDPQPFTHSFPKGHYQTSLSGAPSCSAVPGCSQPAPCNLALELPMALRHSLIILCMAGLHSWVLSVGNVVVCLFVCCLFWSSWRLLTDKHCMGVALLVKACRSFMDSSCGSSQAGGNMPLISSSPQLCSHSLTLKLI